MRNPNENDKELQDADKNTTYLHVSNIALMRYSDNKDISDFIEELKKIYKIESVLKNINFDNVMKKTHEKTQFKLTTNSRSSYRILSIGSPGSRKTNALQINRNFKY